MRPLTVDELLEVADALGAVPIGDVSGLASVEEVDAGLVGVMARLLVVIVEGRPFDRRNDAVAVAAVGLLARLNGSALELEPHEDVILMLGEIQRGLPATEVRAWLDARLARPASTGAHCPVCSMPLREALAIESAGRLGVPMCGGCGHVLAPPFRHRPLQEV